MTVWWSCHDWATLPISICQEPENCSLSWFPARPCRSPNQTQSQARKKPTRQAPERQRLLQDIAFTQQISYLTWRILEVKKKSRCLSLFPPPDRAAWFALTSANMSDNWHWMIGWHWVFQSAFQVYESTSAGYCTASSHNRWVKQANDHAANKFLCPWHHSHKILLVDPSTMLGTDLLGIAGGIQFMSTATRWTRLYKMLCRELPFPKKVSTHNRAEQRAATITSIGKWKPKPGLNKPQRSLSALSRSLSLSLLHNHFFTTGFFCLNNSWQTRKLNTLALALVDGSITF